MSYNYLYRKIEYKLARRNNMEKNIATRIKIRYFQQRLHFEIIPAYKILANKNRMLLRHNLLYRRKLRIEKEQQEKKKNKGRAREKEVGSMGNEKRKNENEKDSTGEKEREVTPSRIAYGGAPQSYLLFELIDSMSTIGTVSRTICM